MRRPWVRGLESNAAYWPGKSREMPTPREDSWDRPPALPRPGRAEIAGGVATADGERSWRSARAAASGLPDSATRSYIAHNWGSKLAQPPPELMKMLAQSFLKTPFGNRASARFQYVIAGAMASTRSSYPAA